MIDIFAVNETWCVEAMTGCVVAQFVEALHGKTLEILRVTFSWSPKVLCRPVHA